MSDYFKSMTGVDLARAPKPEHHDCRDLLAMAYDRNDHLEKRIKELESQLKSNLHSLAVQNERIEELEKQLKKSQVNAGIAWGQFEAAHEVIGYRNKRIAELEEEVERRKGLVRDAQRWIDSIADERNRCETAARKAIASIDAGDAADARGTLSRALEGMT